MHTIGWNQAAHALRSAAVAAVLAACAGDRALGPASDVARAETELAATAFAATARAASDDAGRGVELGACEQLRAPEGSVLAAHLYAEGVQVYRWNGAGWLFEGPSAALYADARFTGQVGTHFAGPTWVHEGGSTVRGSSPVACVVDPDAIAWLLLRATPDPVPGLFGRVTAIQRVNTTGGRSPTAPGAAPGEVRRVPYTAEYYFYR